MKRAIIIHGWGGSPKGGWIPWLKKELESHGFQVITPQMPHTDFPTIAEWVPYLTKIVGEPDKETYLIGHSIGCQTILRYLESIDEKIGGAVFVAGWLTLSELDTPEEKEIAKLWVEIPIDFEKIKPKSKFISIFSDDDPYVPEENWTKFEDLGDVIIEDGLGHIEGVTSSILTSVLKLSK